MEIRANLPWDLSAWPVRWAASQS